MNSSVQMGCGPPTQQVLERHMRRNPDSSLVGLPTFPMPTVWRWGSIWDKTVQRKTYALVMRRNKKLAIRIKGVGDTVLILHKIACEYPKVAQPETRFRKESTRWSWDKKGRISRNNLASRLFHSFAGLTRKDSA